MDPHNVNDGPFWVVYEKVGGRWWPCMFAFAAGRGEAQNKFVKSTGVPGWKAAYAKGFRCSRVFVVPTVIVRKRPEGA